MRLFDERRRMMPTKTAWLRAFTTVVELGSLASAASQLHTSQSALSRQLAALEESLGIKLLQHRRRRLVPTTGGNAFYGHARRALASVDELEDIAREIRHGRGQRLRILSVPRLDAVMVRAVERLRLVRPGLRVSLEVQRRRFMERSLVGRHFDIGFGALPTSYPGIRTMPLCRVPSVAVVHPEHRLADRDTIELAELLDDDLVTTTRGTLIRETAEGIFLEAGAELDAAYEISSGYLACSLVAHKVGFTITDPLVPRILPFGSLRLIPVQPSSYMHFGLLLTEDAAPDWAIVDVVKESMRELLELVPSVAELSTIYDPAEVGDPERGA